MAPPYVAGAVRCDIRYQLTSGQHVQNVVFVAKSETATFFEMADRLRSDWVGNIMPFLTSNVVLREVQLTDFSGPDGETWVVTDDTPGGSSSAPMPPNVAIALSWRTGLTGRSNRGRTFLPGIGEDKVDGGGIIVASFVTALVSAGEGLLVALGLDDIPLVVASRKNGTGTAVTTCTVDNIVDTQRRRLR